MIGRGFALHATVFGSGAAVMIVEVVGTRVVGPVFGVSLFVWAALLSATLFSLAVGYALGGTLVDRRPNEQLLGAALIAAGALLGVAGGVSRPVLLFAIGLGPRIGPLLAATALFTPCLVCMGMVGPVAIRLLLDQVSAAGRRSGAVYAVSTAGSLLGTWAVAFYLVPTFDTQVIVWGTASLLCLLGLMWMPPRARIVALVFALLPWLQTSAPAPLPAPLHRVARAHGPYSLLEVIDDSTNGIRMLRADHSIIGAQFVTDRSAAFSFLHLLESLRFMRPAAKDMLQIGLGIGSLPMALQAHGIRADVVEIDPEVVRLAREDFGFETRGAVYVEDARTFLARAGRRYDLIAHDTFTGGATPEHLLSMEVVRQIRARLLPGGVLAVAFAGFERGPAAEASFAVMRTLRAVFPGVRAFRDGPAEDGALSNLLFFASEQPLELTIPADASFENGTCRHLLRHMQEFEVLRDVPAGPVITDERNPLARLQIASAEQHFAAMAELLPNAVWVP